MGAVGRRRPKNGLSSWPAVTAPSTPNRSRWFASVGAVANVNHSLAGGFATLILIWYCRFTLRALHFIRTSTCCARQQQQSFSRFLLVTHTHSHHVCIFPVFFCAATRPPCTSPLSFSFSSFLSGHKRLSSDTLFVNDTPLDLLSIISLSLFLCLHLSTLHYFSFDLLMMISTNYLFSLFNFFELVYYLFCFHLLLHFVFTNLNILFAFYSVYFMLPFCNISSTNIFVSNHNWVNSLLQFFCRF